MRRRDLLAMPLVAGSASAAAGPIAVDPKSVRLKLKHTWTTTMSSSDYRDTLHLTLHRGGVSAFGEGAPIVRYKETAAEGVEWLKSLTPELEKADWRQFSKLLGQIFERHPEHWAAKSALANALAQTGRYPEAEIAFKKGNFLSPGVQAWLYAREGNPESAGKILNDNSRFVDAHTAVARYLLGDRKAGFAELGDLTDQWNAKTYNLRNDPLFDPLRNDPGFVEIVKRSGLLDN